MLIIHVRKSYASALVIKSAFQENENKLGSNNITNNNFQERTIIRCSGTTLLSGKWVKFRLFSVVATIVISKIFIYPVTLF